MKNSRNGIGLYRSRSMQGKVFQDFFQMCSFDKQAEWSSFFDEEQLGNPLQNSENVSYDHKIYDECHTTLFLLNIPAEPSLTMNPTKILRTCANCAERNIECLPLSSCKQKMGQTSEHFCKIQECRRIAENSPIGAPQPEVNPAVHPASQPACQLSSQFLQLYGSSRALKILHVKEAKRCTVT